MEVTATAICQNYTCEISHVFDSLCCCPTINLRNIVGNCDDQGNRPVTLSAGINITSNCPVTVQWDFGNGSFGQPITYNTPGSYAISETHTYIPGNYTAQLLVTSPVPCSSVSMPVVVPPCSPVTCCPNIISKVDVGECDADGNRIATFNLDINLISGCPPIVIQIAYGNGTFSPAQIINNSGTYIFTKTYSPNTTPYTASVNVISPFGCPSNVMQINIPPCNNPCCPTVSVSTDIGECKLNGNFNVNFDVNISTPPNCPKPLVQLDFGDGSNSIVSSSSYTTNHTYNSNNAPYTATVNIITPTGCPSQTVTIDTSNCCKTFRRWFCPIVYAIATFAAAIGLYLILFAPCTLVVDPSGSLAATLTTIGVALLVLAVIALILFLIFCTACLCGWFYLFLWRVLFGVGILYAIFAGCCGGTTAFITGLIMMALGILFLFLWRNHCHKSTCEILNEVILIMSGYVLTTTAFVLSFAVALPALLVCLYVLFIIPGINFPFTFYLLVTIVYAILHSYYLSNCD